MAFCLTSFSTQPPPSVPIWPPSGSMIIIEPAFCGVEPRVSTTWQTISSRSCSRALIKCRMTSRIQSEFPVDRLRIANTHSLPGYLVHASAAIRHPARIPTAVVAFIIV